MYRAQSPLQEHVTLALLSDDLFNLPAEKRCDDKVSQ